eukprot:12429965-Alexandrium_andersonii.AAC.1
MPPWGTPHHARGQAAPCTGAKANAVHNGRRTCLSRASHCCPKRTPHPTSSRAARYTCARGERRTRRANTSAEAVLTHVPERKPHLRVVLLSSH